MSGGVDSSVAAVLLMEQGYEVSGATFKLFENEDIGIIEKTRTCCSLEDVQDAKSVAQRLGFRHDVFNFGIQFQNDVILPFAEAYMNGETPNPCIECNRSIKFEKFLQRALLLEHDYIATGHYARIEKNQEGRYLLKKALDETKDQSYALYTMTQEELSRTLFPLGPLRKTEIRKIAEEKGFINAKKPDSQDICFVKDGDYAGFLEKTLGVQGKDGDFVDAKGVKIGRHQGIIHYTIGQRKGLGKTFGKPMYVLKIDNEKNQVTLGDNEELFSDNLRVGNVNLISLENLKEPMEVSVKTRYTQPEVPATIYPSTEGTIFIKFKNKQRAITPGQAAVFYQGDVVVGGGKILKGDKNEDNKR